ERTTGNYRAFKEAKYEGAAISKSVDDVRGVDVAPPRLEQPRSWYEVDEDTGFCKVIVVDKQTKPYHSERRRKVRVYNFSVEEDESYIAGHVAVHNCTQDQSPFMRKKRIEAHVGGGIC